jgi:hypothetical protein
MRTPRPHIAVWIIALAGFLILGSPFGAISEESGKLLLFSTLSDLLKGDLWQWATQEDVKRQMLAYPERYSVIGIGTTNWPERMGEVMVQGTVKNLTFQWADPEYPNQIQRIDRGVFPWLQVAVVDSRKGGELRLDKADDLHWAIIEELRRRKVRICALTINAIASNTHYTVTHSIPKSGLDLSVPMGKETYLRAFKDESQARWTIQGIFVDDAVGSCGMVPGLPLLLMGYNRDTRNGGLVTLAKVERAEVQYYPIDSHELLKSDLSVAGVEIRDPRISTTIKNLGVLTAEHVKVQLSLPGSRRESEAVLTSVAAQEERKVKFNISPSPRDRNIVVQIDPEGQIFEGNRENNRMERRRGWFGW